jgi:ABC-2 type transport system ATP-binding protein
MSVYAVETGHLEHRFGRRRVLSDVTLAIPHGGVTAILGRNGVGKTTLLRDLVGFLKPSSGKARVLGLNPRTESAEIRRRIGFLPERFELPAWMSVRDHLRFLEPFYPSWNREEEARLLDLFCLDPNAKVDRLSKGERTKHVLLAALVHEPELLLLDEPFSGLDPSVRADILSAILDHLREEGRTVLIASHSLPDVERVADRLVLLEAGRVALSGDLEEIRSRTVRLQVTLTVGEERWAPPGRPLIERYGDDMVLTYLDWDEEYEARIAIDPDVLVMRRIKRDLNHVFLAAVRGEKSSCVVSLL